jgi:hypothetical protein
MKLELSMFTDLNNENVHLNKIHQITPNRTQFSFTTKHEITLYFFENAIDISCSSEIDEAHLDFLLPFIARMKEIIYADHDYRLQTILNRDYFKVDRKINNIIDGIQIFDFKTELSTLIKEMQTDLRK